MDTDDRHPSTTPTFTRTDLRSRTFETYRGDLRPWILDHLGELFGPNLGPTVLDLTARHPYADDGWMDFYNPGRWDCGTDLVYMDAIVSTGDSVGMWEGTVGYVTFTPPGPGSYLVALTFTGWDHLSMSLHGAFGDVSAPSSGTHKPTVLTAPWTAGANDQLWASFSARDSRGWSALAYVSSFRVHRLG